MSWDVSQVIVSRVRQETGGVLSWVAAKQAGF